jgi:hypothetical protein
MAYIRKVVKMNYKDLKILIVVKGGVIQSIYSSEKEIHFDILDLDNEEVENKEEEKKLFESRSKGLTPIY